MPVRHADYAGTADKYSCGSLTISAVNFVEIIYSMMVFLILTRSWLWQSRDSCLFGVDSDRYPGLQNIESVRTFSTFSGGTHRVCAGLLGFGLSPGAIDEESGQYSDRRQ